MEKPCKRKKNTVPKISEKEYAEYLSFLREGVKEDPTTPSQRTEKKNLS